MDQTRNESHPMTAPFYQPLSICCHAPMQVYCADEGTQCYICTKCSRPTDAFKGGDVEVKEYPKSVPYPEVQQPPLSSEPTEGAADQPAPDVEAVRGRVEANDYFGNPSTLVDMKKLLAAIEQRDRRIDALEAASEESDEIHADLKARIAELERQLASAKKDTESWADQADQRTSDWKAEHNKVNELERRLAEANSEIRFVQQEMERQLAEARKVAEGLATPLANHMATGSMGKDDFQAAAAEALAGFEAWRKQP